jgi:predicted enzyme related to lactoylglutathione lyase
VEAVRSLKNATELKMNYELRIMKLDSAIFYTNNLEKVINFYRDVISLEVDYIQEGHFASFKFKNGKLGIKQAKEEREVPGHQTIFIEVDGIGEMYNKLKSKKVTIQKELVTEDWATNFSILDPDGNKLQFMKK